MLSKAKYFKDNYLDENGSSKLIERYKLPPELYIRRFTCI